MLPCSPPSGSRKRPGVRIATHFSIVPLLSSPRLDRNGSRIAADNRRQPIAYFQQLVEEQQQQQIAQIAKRLARYEDADSGELASAKRPAIYRTGNWPPPQAPGLAARLKAVEDAALDVREAEHDRLQTERLLTIRLTNGLPV
jgi:hypothetical protein